MIVYEMTATEMKVDKIIVDEMPVDEMSWCLASVRVRKFEN